MEKRSAVVVSGALVLVVAAIAVLATSASETEPAKGPGPQDLRTASAATARPPRHRSSDITRKTVHAAAESGSDVPPSASEVDARELLAEAETAASVATRTKAIARVPRCLHEVLEGLIAAKVDEPPDVFETPHGVVAARGSMAAAVEWANSELRKLAISRVGDDLSIGVSLVETAWMQRERSSARTATYGSGSFVVVKASGTGASPGSASARAKFEKPLTAEEWWSRASADARAAFLTASFVESSGMFEIARADETRCDICCGTGEFTSTDIAGDATQRFCSKCNGTGVFRTIEYR